MRASKAPALAGRGFYTIPEASRLTGLSVPTVKRYSIGYGYDTLGGVRQADAAFKADLVSEGEGGKGGVLSFLDLIELRMIRLFRERGVSGREVRRAEEAAAEVLKVSHPFATGRFRTLGATILLQVGTARLIEIAKSQELMTKVIAPFAREVHFEGDTPVLWVHPRGNDLVVLDPTRSFGHPIVRRSGVPTYILAEAASAWGPLEAVARWYEVQPAEVEAALKFEGRRKAA